MKLVTHNFLTSNFLKGVVNGYPLILTATKVEEKSDDNNDDFVRKVLPKLDYGVLRQAAESIGVAEGLPPELNDKWETDTELMTKLRHILVSVDVMEGELKCPVTGRVFPIKGGIPNMLANEDEVE
uniref:Multifunctional methyltransferase subunit TRM112-like protein n=1 Tax=Syphacia muris TaxID=451379 RepID=A0A0N5A7Q5_9BILA